MPNRPLSRDFVCVEVDVGMRNLRVVDEFRIDSIPRTIIFTPVGRSSIVAPDTFQRRVRRLAEGSWDKRASVAPEPNKAVAPAPVRAPAAVAKVVIWFVDGTRGIVRWSDGDWTNHAHLLRLLHAAGIEREPSTLPVRISPPAGTQPLLHCEFPT